MPCVGKTVCCILLHGWYAAVPKASSCSLPTAVVQVAELCAQQWEDGTEDGCNAAKGPPVMQESRGMFKQPPSKQDECCQVVLSIPSPIGLDCIDTLLASTSCHYSSEHIYDEEGLWKEYISGKAL